MSRARPIALAAGVAGCAAAVALVPDEPLSRHMLQHSLLVAVAAPLIAYGMPSPRALGLAPAARRRLARATRRGPLSVAADPVTAWIAFVAVQWAVHLTGLLGLTEGRPALHAGVHALLVATAVLFWMPVLARVPLGRPLRGGARSLYLLLAVPANDLVALGLMATGHPEAGAVMLAGMIAVPIAAVVVTWHWMRAETARAERWEALCVERGWSAYP